MLTHAELKEKALTNSEVRQAYDELNKKYALDELLNNESSIKSTDSISEQAEKNPPQ